MSMSSGKQRQKARRAAVQALYQWDLTNQTPAQIEKAMPSDSNLSALDVEYFRSLIRGVTSNLDDIDAMLEPGLDRTLAELDPVERSVLRVAAFELAHHHDVPWRVILDEAVAAAKLFGADNGYKMVNTVLDRIAAERREESAGS